MSEGTTTLRGALQSVYTQHSALTPTILVKVASDPQHPLHERFEWDDTIAAHEYRLVQARELIRMAVVRIPNELTDGTTRIRAFHPVTQPDGKSIYEPIENIIQDNLKKTLLLRQAEREWRSLKQRYQHLAEFMDLVAADLIEGDTA